MNAPDTSQVARRRAAAPHTSMFLRMLVRAAVLRRGRAASALLAMVVAAAVATAMLNLYVDVQAKLRREFRKYGANVVVIAKDGQNLPTDTLSTVRSVLGANGIAVPFAYAVARTADGHSVVVAGTDFEQVQKAGQHLVVSHRLAESFSRCPGWHSRCQRRRRSRQAVRPQLSGSDDSTESGGHFADWRRRR